MVHLDTDPAEGPTVNPVVERPVCGRTWIAAGTQYLFDLSADSTAEELEAAAQAILEQIGADDPPKGEEG
jgi:hypothetical protein